MEESGAADGKVTKEFYSKLVKADAHGKDQVEDLVIDAPLLFIHLVQLKISLDFLFRIVTCVKYEFEIF